MERVCVCVHVYVCVSVCVRERTTLSAECLFMDDLTIILVPRISSSILERNGDIAQLFNMEWRQPDLGMRPLRMLGSTKATPFGETVRFLLTLCVCMKP